MFVLVAPQRDIGRRQREGAAVQHRVHVGRLLDVGAAVDLEVVHRARHAGRETAEEAAGQAVKRRSQNRRCRSRGIWRRG